MQQLPTQPIRLKHSTATGPQSRFWSSRAPFRLFVGGAGSGKTRAAVLEILRMPSGSTGMVVGPTYRMVYDSTLATFFELTRNGGVLRSFNKSDMSAQLVNGTSILFRSADEPDRLRGVNLGWFALDEGALCTLETWLILLARLRESPGRAWVCTTPRGFDWLYDTFVKTESPDYDVIRSSTRENLFLPANFVERLQAQYTSQWQRQEIEGEFCELEGSLFKRGWFQIIEHAPEGLRWSRYWDLAASVKTQADFSASACVALHTDTGDVYLRDVIKMKEEWPVIRRAIIQTALSEPGVQLGIESAMHGLAGFQELMREPELAGTSLRSIRVDKDKVSRALPVASRAEAGKLKLVRGNWIADFIDEATSFPHGPHDDQVDSVSGAFQMLTEPKLGKLITW
ncbi:MAG: phage terminase large subunit [Pyrinomonadaceae bacterium]